MKIFIFIFLMIFLSNLSRAADLQVFLTADKDIYNINDVILITIELKNVSNKNYQLPCQYLGPEIDFLAISDLNRPLKGFYTSEFKILPLTEKSLVLLRPEQSCKFELYGKIITKPTYVIDEKLLHGEFILFEDSLFAIRKPDSPYTLQAKWFFKKGWYDEKLVARKNNLFVGEVASNIFEFRISLKVKELSPGHSSTKH